MNKFIKLLNEKKDQVQQIQPQKDDYESLSEESDNEKISYVFQFYLQPLPSVITSSSQELLSLLNNTVSVSKRTRKNIPQTKKVSPPKKRARVRIQPKQIHIQDEEELINEIGNSVTQNTPSPINISQNKDEKNEISLESLPTQIVSLTQIITPNEIEDNIENKQTDKNNEINNKSQTQSQIPDDLFNLL